MKKAAVTNNMALNFKQIYDINHMNVAAQNIDMGNLLNSIIDQTAVAITAEQAYDLDHMNVAAQNAKLGTLINSIIDQQQTALTDKQIADLNSMNVASQNIQLGSLLIDMMNTDNLVHGGKLNPFDDIDDYTAAVATFSGKDVYLKIDSAVKHDFHADLTSADANPAKLHLIVTNCEFDGNVYGANLFDINNCVELVFKNCKFIDVSNSSPNTIYALIKNVQDAEITIEDCVFISTGETSSITIAQDSATQTTIKNVAISDCYFDTETNVADIVFGNTVPEDVTFPATITNNNTNFTLKFANVEAGVDKMNYLKADMIYIKGIDNTIEVY